MNSLDWVLLALLILAGLRGLMRGMVKELFSVAAPVAGLAAAVFLYKWGATVLVSRFHLQFAPEVLACIILFLIAFLVVKIIATIVREGLEAAKLDTLDRGLGFVVGLVEGAVVVALLLIVIQVQPVFDVKKLLAGSTFATTLLPIVGPEVAKAFSSLASPGGAMAPGALPGAHLPATTLTKP